MAFINPENTGAILIGVSEFQDKSFINAEPIKNNVLKIKELLLNNEIIGLKDENILTFNNNERHDDIIQSIMEFVGNSFIDTIIFYFAGHGYKNDKDGLFYLVTNNTKKDFVEVSSIRWDTIKDMLEKGNGIQQRFYILDACHAGSAALGEDDDECLINEGSALIAAAKADSKSYFNATDEYTYFSNAFISILENGIEEIEKPGIEIKPLYNLLSENLQSKNFEVTNKTTHKIDSVQFFKNKKYDENAIKKREIERQVKEGISCYKKLDFNMAEIIFGRVLSRIEKEKIVIGTEFIQDINERLEESRQITDYESIFHNRYKNQFEKEIENLKQRLNDEIENKNKAEENFSKEIETLKVENEILTEEKGNASENINRCQNKIEQLRKQLKEKSQIIDLNANEINNFKQELSENKDTIDSKNKTIAELNRNIDDLKTKALNISKSDEANVAKNKTLQKKQNELNKEIMKLKNEINSLNRNIKSVSEEHNSANNVNEKIKKENHELRKKNEITQKEKVNINNELSKVKELVSLKEKEANDIYSDHKNISESNSKLKAQILKLEKEISQKNEELEKHKQNINQYISSTKNENKKELLEIQTDNIKLKKEIENLSKQKVTLEKQIDENRRIKKQDNEIYKKNQKEINKLKEAIDKQVKELNSKLQIINNLENAIKEDEQIYYRIVHEVNTLKEKVSQKQEEILRLQKQNISMHDNDSVVGELKKIINKDAEIYFENQKKMDELTYELNSYIRKYEDCRKDKNT